MRLLFVIFDIEGYFTLCYYRLDDHKLFVPILLVAIVGYSFGGYWWLFINDYWLFFYWWLLYWWLLMVIDNYFINGYLWLLVVILLVAIGCYSINGY